jgi:glucosamine kinase
MSIKLIADSGSTKCEWCLVANGEKKSFITKGISPYFLNKDQIIDLLQKELLTKLQNIVVDELYFYGTGLGNAINLKMIKEVLKKLFPSAKIEVNHDMLAAARALCGNEKGIACILGTGSNSCYFDGKKVVKNNPAIGYVLGDEGSGAYLGKKVVQYFLYNTFDENLKSAFHQKFNTNATEILENVYKKPLPNRYLASFTIFLAENRGHYMVENILEDGLNDFFFTHLLKYSESQSLPIHFTGSVAYGFRDVLKEICSSYQLQLGNVIKAPMQGLIEYHNK